MKFKLLVKVIVKIEEFYINSKNNSIFLKERVKKKLFFYNYFLSFPPMKIENL